MERKIRLFSRKGMKTPKKARETNDKNYLFEMSGVP